MKKTLALLLTLAMVFSMVLPVGAFGFETVETVAEELPAAVQSEPEAAALAAEVIPGKNLLTGTKDVMTFDDATEADLLIGVDNFASKTIVEKPTSLVDESALDADGTYGKILQFHREPVGRHWSNLKFNHTFDGTRKFWFTWDHYFDMADVKTNWGAAIWFIPASEGNHMSFDTTPNKWTHTSKTGTPLNGKSFDWQFRMGTVAEENGACANPLNFYIDNFGVFPFYKINYVMPDGTAVTEDFLFADGVEWKAENIATEYFVKTDNLPAPFSKNGKIYNCIGWSTEMNSDIPLVSVGLENADVTLYPVLQETQILTADKYAVIVNSESDVATITANQEVNWSYTIVGADDTLVTTAPDIATVVAGKENGSVKLSATLVSDPTVTAEIEILVIGSSNWRPGLNLFTGTESVLDFETLSEEALYAIFNKEGNLNIYDNATTKNGVNYSDKAMTQGAAAGYPSIWMKDLTPTISTDRPLLIEYDYRGKFGNHWMMINGSGAQDIFKDVRSGNVYPATETWKHVRLENQKSEADNKYHEIKRLAIEIGDGSDIYICIDNIRYVPYYQITYKNYDDSVAKTEFVLLDDSGNFMTTYTPDTSVVAGAVAYSLEKNGDPVETVELKNKDITLYPMKTLSGPITYTDGTSSKQDKPDYTVDYTVPSPESLGFTIEHFVAWITKDGRVFYPNTVVKAADTDSIKGLTLTAFCQDLTKPAMGYAYEGNTELGIAKYKYQEIIEDEGRTVNHLRLFGGTYDGTAKRWLNDARFHLSYANGFDASEYNIVQYNYKITSSINVTDVSVPKEPTPEQLTGEIQNPDITIYCMYDAGTFYGSAGTMMIGNNEASKLINDKQYHVVELDMSTPTHQSDNIHWTGGKNGKLYGFAVDMNRAYYSGDTYLDYFRVYRDGIFTVTYDTNAPAGFEDMIQTEVDPDTGRGGGTGYMLKGEHPEITGFTFRGWATTPDATVEDVVDSINLTGDTTVYAVWSDILASPKVDKSNINIRSGADNVNGIRFSSSVTTRNKAMLEEYGFIIAREDVLGSNELTFMFKKKDANKPLYVYGAAYDKKKGLDLQYDVSGSNIIFTAVCTNIPAEHYATKLVARTYAKYAVNGNAFTVYGDSVVKSIKEVAQSIKDAGGAAYEDNKDYIDSILA